MVAVQMNSSTTTSRAVVMNKNAHTMPRIVDRPGRTRCCDLFLGNVEYRNQRPFCLISRQPRTVQYLSSMARVMLIVGWMNKQTIQCLSRCAASVTVCAWVCGSKCATGFHFRICVMPHFSEFSLRDLCRRLLARSKSSTNYLYFENRYYESSNRGAPSRCTVLFINR